MIKYKILIVEDSRLVSKILEKKFTHYGYECIVCKSFSTAQERLQNAN